MAIMDVARLTRLDVVLSTAYLTTKAQHPKRVTIKWRPDPLHMKGTISHGIIVHCRQLKFHLHCDASWASHHDGSSHTEWESSNSASPSWGRKASGVPIIYRRKNTFYLSSLSRQPQCVKDNIKICKNKASQTFAQQNQLGSVILYK